MLALARIGMLVERSAIEKNQAVSILGKMRRHPIDNDGDAFLMATVDQVHEILGRAEARSGREVSDDLIAPRSRERMLHDGQHFYVRVAHALHVLDEIPRHL